jgi:hypothetical protein
MQGRYITIRRINLPIDRLEKLPDIERDFLFLSGHVLNELNALNKSFSWSLNPAFDSQEPEVQLHARRVQSMVYARILAGKLLEAWNAINVAWYGTKLSKSLNSTLDLDAQKSLKKIKSYFGRENAIYRVRNSFAFHYSASEIGKAWRCVPINPGYACLFGGTIGNNLDLGSELVANAAVLSAIDSTNIESALETFIVDIQSMLGLVITFFEGASMALIEKTLDGKLDTFGANEQLIVTQKFSEVKLPYFCFPDENSDA